MRDELLAYLLNDIDSQQRIRIEARLDSDPIWQHELERLRSYLQQVGNTGAGNTGDGEADVGNTGAGNTGAGNTGAGETDTLPVDLVSRTCSFVRQASSQGALSPAVLPASLTESQDAAAPTPKRWSLLDLTIVASISLVLGTLLLPALRESRDAARRIQCQENLHSLGKALASFAQQTDGQLPLIERDENAGMYALKLVESGILTEDQLVQLLVCPSSKLADKVFNGDVVMCVPNRLELRSATSAHRKSLLEKMGGSFAYRFGYLDKQGNYRQVKLTGSRSAPVMADKPSYDIVGFYSANHKGCQENVLFQDQSVGTINICAGSGTDKHWFLNEDEKHAAGNNKFDIVMGRSEARPTGISVSTASSRLRRIPASRGD